MSTPYTERPKPSAPREYSFPQVVRSKLANGVEVAVAQITRLPIVAVSAVVDAGDSVDPAGAEGVASLAALALSEGTTKLDGAKLTERFELLGTGLDTDASWDDATGDLTVTPARVDAAVELLGEVLTSPAFDERQVERLKSERIATLLQQQVDPGSLADDQFTEFLYATGSRYAVPMAGNIASTKSLDAAAVRAFHARSYTPAATTLVFAGDITPDHALKITERALGAWRSVVRTGATLDDSVNAHPKRVRVVNKADAPQTELRVGHRGVPRIHPDYFPLVVMNAILGGLFSSRINMNLREKNGYTYGAHSAFEWRRGAGPFIISTAVGTEVTGAAAREILLEVGKLRETPVGAEELSLATAYLDGVFPLRYETTSAIADAIALAKVYGLPDDYFTRYRERVRAVTAADVLQVAQAHLHPAEMIILAVGNADAILEPLGELGLGPAERHELEEVS